jgi:hypothetical protein
MILKNDRPDVHESARSRHPAIFSMAHDASVGWEYARFGHPATIWKNDGGLYGGCARYRGFSNFEASVLVMPGQHQSFFVSLPWMVGRSSFAICSVHFLRNYASVDPHIWIEAWVWLLYHYFVDLHSSKSASDFLISSNFFSSAVSF